LKQNMPPNSGQYDDESDNESISNALSPSDGYFNEAHTHPGDVLIPDPSRGNSSLDKEREAREELASNRSEGQPAATGSRPPQPQAQSPRQSPATSPTRQGLSSTTQAATETTPLIPAAPPAYSPPTPGSPYHQHIRNISEVSTGTYHSMGQPSRFFPERSPENLGGQDQLLLGQDGDRKSWWKKVSFWLEYSSEKLFKYIILIVALLIGIGFICDLIIGIKSQRGVSWSNSKIWHLTCI
jgi:hypothetical protein